VNLYVVLYNSLHQLHTSCSCVWYVLQKEMK